MWRENSLIYLKSIPDIHRYIFQKVGKFWSVRISLFYRALAVKDGRKTVANEIAKAHWTHQKATTESNRENDKSTRSKFVLIVPHALMGKLQKVRGCSTRMKEDHY